MQKLKTPLHAFVHAYGSSEINAQLHSHGVVDVKIYMYGFGWH